MTQTLGARRELALSDRTVEALRSVPLRFWLVAVVAGVLSSSGIAVTRWYPFSSLRNDEAIAFAQGVMPVVAAVLGLAPLVALRSVTGATVLCVLPLSLTLMGGGEWPFSVFGSLVASGVVATWRRPRAALLPLGVALLLVVTLVTSVTNLQVPYGALIEIDAGGGAGPLERIVPLLMYVVALGLAFAAGLWLRSSALQARRLATLGARADEVEEHAVAVGERARLAHDLHDVVAHHVSLIAVRAETAPYTHPDLPPGALDVLAGVAADARSALDELRGVLGVLRRAEADQPSLAPQPSLADVVGLVDTARAAGEHVTLDLQPSTWVGTTAGYVAYRVVQESLTNARRHAPGLPVHVTVTPDVGRLLVRVTTPYVAEQRHSGGAGRGLAGMRERVEGIGGTLLARVQDDLFVVVADLPRGVPSDDTDETGSR